MIFRRSLVLTAVTLLLLAGCSRHTLLTVEADVLSFLSDEERAGEFSLAADEYLLPDEEGLTAEQLGVPAQMLEGLEGLTLDFSAAITSNAATGSEEVAASFHISDSSDASPFDSPAIASTSVSLEPGETEQLTFAVEVSDSVNPDALATLKSGDFRLGVRLEYVAGPSASGVDYRLDDVTISITVRPGNLLPF
ncbi:MAG: hypothetical protein WD314_03095 [Trueperaceae bacterium]